MDGDYEAVLACQRGDVSAFQPLVEKYQKRLLNLAYRVTGDYDEACEVVQESFLSAYRAIKRFRGEAQFATWLYRITINHARNSMKKMQSRSHVEVQSLDDPIRMAEIRTTPDASSRESVIVERLEQKEIQAHVQRCINALDNDYREVLILRDIQEFSYDEIRAILGVPDGTVKSRLFRAREAMKLCLKQVIDTL